MPSTDMFGLNTQLVGMSYVIILVLLLLFVVYLPRPWCCLSGRKFILIVTLFGVAAIG